ncbi:hypothetical protein [Bilophila wadsworthia]|uniref:hypothetical protein n=1 Tax=Bilophila wadsworthia TaxID=35833 RepID=UPI0028E8867B|nr:hypothetical protein [Bilophila wadsworthia]
MVEKEMDSAIIGLIGVILGASIQYIYMIRAEKRKKHLEKKAQVYTYFVELAAGLPFEQPFFADPNYSYDKLIRYRSLIILIGSDIVISSVNKFFKSTKRYYYSKELFCDVIYAMRKDLIDDKYDKDTIKKLVFNILEESESKNKKN